jgi:hypothetical protein
MLLKIVEKLVKPFTGILAPKVLKDDPWFGPTPILSITQEEYVAMRYQLELENQLIPQSEDKPREVDNIHAVMYDIATNTGKTTISGPGVWQSGVGFDL